MSEIYLHLDDEEQTVLRTIIGSDLGEPMPDLGLIDKAAVLAGIRRNITDLQMLNALPDPGFAVWPREMSDLGRAQEKLQQAIELQGIASHGFKRAQEALDAAVEREKHGKSQD